MIISLTKQEIHKKSKEIYWIYGIITLSFLIMTYFFLNINIYDKRNKILCNQCGYENVTDYNEGNLYKGIILDLIECDNTHVFYIQDKEFIKDKWGNSKVQKLKNKIPLCKTEGHTNE